MILISESGQGKAVAERIKDIVIDYDTYVEPFAGSFECGFELLRGGRLARAILNDPNPEIANFWNCVKDNCQELVDLIGLFIKSSDISKIHVESMISAKKAPVLRAATFWLKQVLNCPDANINNFSQEFFERSRLLKNVTITNCNCYRMLPFSDAFWMISSANADEVKKIISSSNPPASWCAININPSEIKNIDSRYSRSNLNFNNRKYTVVFSGDRERTRFERTIMCAV